MTRYKFRDTARAAAVVATNAPARRAVVDVLSESVGAGTSHPRLAWTHNPKRREKATHRASTVLPRAALAWTGYMRQRNPNLVEYSCLASSVGQSVRFIT